MGSESAGDCAVDCVTPLTFHVSVAPLLAEPVNACVAPARTVVGEGETVTVMVGVPPEIMGIGPIEAIPAALRSAGLQQSDLDWIELNEAFAAQSLAVMNTLGLDPAKVNPNGSGISLGHPIGATGALITVKALYELERIQGQAQSDAATIAAVGTVLGGGYNAMRLNGWRTAGEGFSGTQAPAQVVDRSIYSRGTR